MIGRKRHPVPAPPANPLHKNWRGVLFVDGPLAGKKEWFTREWLNELDMLDPAAPLPASLGFLNGLVGDYRFVSHPEKLELATQTALRGKTLGEFDGFALAYHEPGVRPHPVLATVAKLTAWCATCDNMVHSARDGAVGGGVRTIDTWTHAASNLDLVHQATPAHPITITTHEVRNA